MCPINKKNNRMKPLKIVVLAKQVPDTRNVGPDAMKPDGTVNRGILPTIFNPDDLHALEFALQIKDKIEGTQVIVLTMGPKRAADIVREGYYRGADYGLMVSDRRFGGADTLATSYTLAMTIKKIGDVDMVLAGVQAIDGDTAQTGPQTAEKINFPQVTYVEELIDLGNNEITVKRRLDKGIEIVKVPIPVLMTVNGTFDKCRSRNAKKLLKYKYARTDTELAREEDFIKELVEQRSYLHIPEWNVEDIDAELSKIGLAGSPTKVNKVESIVMKASEAKVLSDSQEDIDLMVGELISSHVIG